MLYVGLDVHWKTSTLCILDHHGREVKTRTVKGDWKRLFKEIDRIDQPFAITYEASSGYGYLYEQLVGRARRVVVAHPGALRLIFRSRRKNDRIDAQRLAKLLYLDEVPPVHVPSLEVRTWRALIEYRRRLIDKRTRCKNGLRALLRSYGIRPPRSLWSHKGRAWLGEVALPALMADLQRQMLLEELDQYDRQVHRLTGQLDRLAAAHPGVALLRTIPGVGPRTAEAVVAYLDDPTRFGSLRQVGAYFGLVPCQDASAGVNRLGHITKQGPPTARKLLVEAAWQVIRRSGSARRRFAQLSGDRPDRRKTALVATAHWLLRVMASMLRSGEVWREAA